MSRTKQPESGGPVTTSLPSMSLAAVGRPPDCPFSHLDSSWSIPLPQNLAWSLERGSRACALGHGVSGFRGWKTWAFERGLASTMASPCQYIGASRTGAEVRPPYILSPPRSSPDSTVDWSTYCQRTQHSITTDTHTYPPRYTGISLLCDIDGTK
jgi:hypothetical protein